MAFLAGALAAQAVPLANPNFDFPDVPADKDYLTYDTGFNPTPAGFGWTLLSGTIEHIGTYWHGPAGRGDQSIDLNGNEAGHIAQTLFLEPGNYELKFALAGNPDGGSVKDLRVSLGSSFEEFSFDSSTHTKTDMGWVRERALFQIPAAGIYSLDFQSLTTGAYGPAIDRISLRAVPESLGYFGLVSLAGLVAFSVLSGKRLKPAEKN